ncbi:MAG: 2-dehydropantoate 2-reductase [Spirochaetota bacterium]
MKIGIVGAGAMGSIFAYFFHKADINLTFFEKNNDIIKNIGSGLNVILGDDTVNIKIDIGNNPLILKGCQIIIIFVKTYDTEDAVKEIAPEIDKTSIIVSLQNGIGSKDIIAKYIHEDRIVYGSTSIGATRVNGNTVRLGGMGDVVIGGADKEAVAIAGSVLKKAGLKVNVSVNPEEVVWKKAIINAGINPLGALLGVPNGKIIESEYGRNLQENIIREAVNVAAKIGLKLDADQMIEQTRNVCKNTSQNICSMLQDVKANRRTEIDSINGIIIKLGKLNSIPTPYNDAVYNLIKAKELLY